MSNLKESVLLATLALMAAFGSEAAAGASQEREAESAKPAGAAKPWDTPTRLALFVAHAREENEAY